MVGVFFYEKIKIYLDELSDEEIMDFLKQEKIDFPSGRCETELDIPIEKDFCIISRIYFDEKYYEDNPARMIAAIENEAKIRGIN